MFGDGVCRGGRGGLWMVKQGYRVECSAVATLRDVRLFRCKRFEGVVSVIGRIGTVRKKRCVFFVSVPAVLKSIQRGSKEQREHHPTKGNRGKNIRFSMLKSYVI